MRACLVGWLLVSKGAAASQQTQCVSDQGATVDWWFAWQLPNGLEYAYFDSESQNGFEEAQQISMDAGMNSCLERTLNVIYNDDDLDMNWLVYNDEDAVTGSSHSSYGHTKGVLAYDDSFQGFWLIHSVPKFPDLSQDSYNYTGSDIYAQSFLCISLNDEKSISVIGTQLQYMKPYIYQWKTNSDGSDIDSINELLSKDWKSGRSITSLIYNYGLTNLTHFARSSDQDCDIMESMISPYYQSGFVWETWRRSPEEDSYCSPQYEWTELNVDSIEWKSGQTFKETQDHSKFGISLTNDPSLVCVGGLNRMTSQDERGGGYACFISDSLWYSVNLSFVSIETCPS